MPPTILEDTGRISYICLSDGRFCIDANDAYVSKIVPYPEDGERSLLIWYAVYDKNDRIAMRINGAYVSVLEYYL